MNIREICNVRRRVAARATMVVLLLLARTLFLGATSAAQSATINYGDFPAETVVYQQMTENSTDPLFPLFGPPIPDPLIADTLNFKPLTFESLTAGASPGADVTDGMLLTTIEAKPGILGIDRVRIFEGGDYTLTGLPNTLGEARAGVHVRLEVVEVDRTPLPVPITFLVDDAVSFALPDDITGFWGLNADFDVISLLAQDGTTSGRATKIDITLNNTLTTLSQDGSTGFIKKKDFFITTTTTIPEPSSAALLILAVLGLGLARIRRWGKQS